MKPLATILINNFNYGRYLTQAIESALAQDYENFEIVVVDDGSTDDSREVIAGFGDRIRPVLKPNGGQSSAFNAGFAASRGDFICLLDSDDWFLPGKVREVTSAFSTTSEAQWVFHPVAIHFPDGSVTIEPTNAQMKLIDLRQEATRGKVSTRAPATSGMSFSRKLLDTILPMPEQIRIASDNYLKFAGMSLGAGVYLDQPLAAMRIHESNAYTLRPDRMFTRAQAHLIIAKELRDRFPQLASVSNKIFSKALVEYVKARRADPPSKMIISQYLRKLSLAETCKIAPRVLYHFLWDEAPALGGPV